MKNTIGSTTASASKFLKKIISLMSSTAKDKSMAFRGKTKGFKAGLAILSQLRNKQLLLGSVAHKIEAILNHKHDDSEGRSKSIVLYNASAPSSSTATHDQYREYYCDDYGNNDDDKYPDRRHSLFDNGEEEEEEEGRDELDPNGSVLDLMRKSKEGGGEDFKIEDEIDHAADLLILKFHKRIKLQKLEESFKRYKEMLQRGA